jgi:hypothetical protein
MKKENLEISGHHHPQLHPPHRGGGEEACSRMGTNWIFLKGHPLFIGNGWITQNGGRPLPGFLKNI